METVDEKIPPNRLQELREARFLTQKEVAKIIDKHVTLVSHHENRSRRMTDADVKAYAKLYKVESYELFITKQSVSE